MVQSGSVALPAVLLKGIFVSQISKNLKGNIDQTV